MDFDKKLFEQVCREYVLNSVSSSKYLRSHLTLLEHAKVYEWTRTKVDYNQLISLILFEGEEKASEEVVTGFEKLVQILVEEEPKKYPFQGWGKGSVDLAKKAWRSGNTPMHPVKKVKRGLLKAAIGTAAVLAAIYLYKKLSDPCVRQCRGKSDCIKTCKITAIKKSIANLEAHMATCKNTPNPEKCQLKIKKEIAKWSNKLRKVEAK